MTSSRVSINRVRLPILLVASCTGKLDISLSPFAPVHSVSRDRFGRPVPRYPAHSPHSGSTLRLKCWLLMGFSPAFRDGGVCLYRRGCQVRFVRETKIDNAHNFIQEENSNLGTQCSPQKRSVFQTSARVASCSCVVSFYGLGVHST